MNFEVLTAVLMKVQAFWMCFIVVGVTISDVSSDHSPSFFRFGKCNPKDIPRDWNLYAYYIHVLFLFI
jgi:hypothetical protein